MCVRDPSQTTLLSQINSLQCIQEVINFSSYPVCVRNSNREFILMNRYFKSELLKIYPSPENWFSCLPQEVIVELSRMEINSFLQAENICPLNAIHIDGVYWDVYFQIISVDNEIFCMWQLNKTCMQRSSNNLDMFSYKKMEDLVIEYRTKCSLNHLYVYSLHVAGLSHESISKILSISPGTSRNIITDVHAFFNTNSRDDLIISSYASGDFLNISKLVLFLIKRNVNKMLLK